MHKFELTKRFICRCLAHGPSCLAFLAIGNLLIVIVVSQTEAIDGILRWYRFPTRFKPELYHSTIHYFPLVVGCVLFVYCDILYNVCMLFILLWERCLVWVVVIVPRLRLFPFGPLFGCIRDLKIVVYSKRLTSDTLFAINAKSLTMKCITYRIYSKYRKLSMDTPCLTTETWRLILNDFLITWFDVWLVPFDVCILQLNG